MSAGTARRLPCGPRCNVTALTHHRRARLDLCLRLLMLPSPLLLLLLLLLLQGHCASARRQQGP
jgi:hypothetical protein